MIVFRKYSFLDFPKNLLFALVLLVFVSFGVIAPVFAEPMSEAELKALNNWTNWVPTDGFCASTASSSSTTTSETPITSPSTAKGESLGGVYGTGFTQAEINTAKSHAKKGLTFKGGSGWLATTYGPPWDSVEGGGTTAVGLSMAGPNNSQGRPRYQIAVDPNVIPYGSLVNVWPNALNWKGPFLATDTGGAIKGKHVDVYDWSGDGTKDTASFNNAKVTPYNPDEAATDTTGDSCSCGPGSSGGSSVLVGKTNAQKAYNWFVSHGISKAGAAGIVGNLMTESGGNTEQIKTTADNGTHHGIAQWDIGGRWDTLVEHSEGKENDLGKQIEFIWYEFTGLEDGKENTKNVVADGANGTAYKLVRKATDPEKAAADFESNFERSGGSAVTERKANARTIYNKYGSGSGGGGSSTGSSDSTCTNGPGGTAFTLGDYAWPIDIGKNELDVGGWSHHDGTPALDISTKKAVGGKDADVVGRSVFAISDGIIKTSHTYTGWVSHQPIPGCQSIEFESDADSNNGSKWIYWYGHIASKGAARQGKKVSKGEKIATVGERKCTDNGSYPHLHIDRGSPQGRDGGSECCRDAGFIDLMKKIYGKMPGD